MTAAEYLDYLINAQQQHEAGEFSFGVKASELALLQALLKMESK